VPVRALCAAACAALRTLARAPRLSSLRAAFAFAWAEPDGVAAVQHLGLADEKDKRAPKKGGGALAASSSADSDGQADEEASGGADATSVPAEASAPGPVRASGSRWGEPAPASPVPAPVWADCAAAMRVRLIRNVVRHTAALIGRRATYGLL
jgi:hypothetical protein